MVVMSLAAQLASAVIEAKDDFFTPQSFKAATSKIPGRLKDASGTAWESKKVEGPKSHEIRGGTEQYAIEKWFPRDGKLPMGASLTVTKGPESGGKIVAEFVIEKDMKPVSTEKTSGDLAHVTKWIGDLVSPE